MTQIVQSGMKDKMLVTLVPGALISIVPIEHRPYVRKYFFINRVAKDWNSLPGFVNKYTHSASFKSRLEVDKFWENCPTVYMTINPTSFNNLFFLFFVSEKKTVWTSI
jgi:hypothetical protein